ncbi:MAG: hypothetical protein M0Q41_08765 [Bacteroidales bacterium]|nr:hypothetical protein [Bacteroidales bacterium]
MKNTDLKKLGRGIVLIVTGITLLLIVSVACRQSSTSKVSYQVDPYNTKIIADEVLQTNSYTYVLAGEKNLQYWIAINKADINKGKTYYYSESMEVHNFHSKELNQTFESILFVGNLSSQPIPASNRTESVLPSMGSSSGTPFLPRIKTDTLNRVDGSLSLAELYEHRHELEGTTIKVVGEVMKYNPAIMGRNWVHIQDGTGKESFFDLTVTTHDMVSVGDIVLFEGVLTLGKDLGSGYYYEIILEDAKGARLSLH